MLLAACWLKARVGRKPVLVVSVLLQPLISAVVAVVPWFSVFLVTRYLLGMALGGTMVISFIMGAELGIGQWRPIVSILNQVPFGMGQTILPLTAYFLRDWRHLQMALSVYCLIFLPYCWLIEESPKWLVATGRLMQAERVASAIRRRNGLSPAAHTEMKPMTEKLRGEIVKANGSTLNNNSVVKQTTKGGVFFELFHAPRLMYYTLAIWTMWYCAGLSFFALNAYQTSLGGDPFINVGVGGLVGGIPGNIATIFLVRRFGKKKVALTALILTSFFSFLIPIYDVGESPYDWQRRLAALATLVAMSVGYPALFLHSSELLPSVLRASLMKMANLMARLGNTTAPLVGPTAVYGRWVPLCIIGSAPLVSVILLSTLPETGQGLLPETIQDVEKKKQWPETVVLSVEEDGKIYHSPEEKR